MQSQWPRRVRSRSAKSHRSARAGLSVEALEARQLLTYSATLSGTSAVFNGSGAGELLAFDSAGGLLRHNALTAPVGEAFASDFDFDSIVPGDQTLAAAITSSVTVVTPSTNVETVTLGTPASPAENLLALFTIGNLGTGNSVLNIDNSGSATNDNLDIDANGVTGSNINVTFPATIRGGINVSTGTGTNTTNVISTFTNEPVRISSGGPLTVNVTNAGSAQSIFAPLTITNATNSTTLNIVDTTNVNNINATVGASSITGLTPAAINYGAGNVTVLSILGGSGDDIYQVNRGFDDTTLNPGAGSDSVSIRATGLPATGSFTTNGGPGFDTLAVDAGGAAVSVIPGIIQVTGRAPIDYSNYESITITNAANTPPDVTAQTFPATAGTQVVDAVVATFTDTDPNDTASTFTATINWGDGTSSAGVVTQDASTPSVFYVTGTHLYKTPGNKSLSVDVLDHGTTSSTIVAGVPVTISTRSVTASSTAVTESVADAPIDVTGVNITGTEAVAIPITTTVATFTSSNPHAVAANYSAVIDWGDGTSTTTGVVTAAGTGPNGVTFSVAPSAAHTYANEGTYPITVTITTTPGTAGIGHSLALIQDGTLAVTGATVDATAGTPIPDQTVATFIDNGGAEPVDSYKIFINWGDGTTGPGYITGFNVGVGGIVTFNVSGHHIYTTPTAGPITGSVTVTTAGGTVGQGTFTSNVHGLNADFDFLAINEGELLNNVTLATLSSNGGPPIAPNYYFATADWGDGTPVTPVMINGSSEIIGSHLYQEHGVYPVTITVGTTGNPNVLTFTRGIIVNEVPIDLKGHLDAASDSGISNSDGITNVVQPTFLGTSEPLSTVTLQAVPAGGGTPINLGSATTDTSGAWIITSVVPLADGTYTINAHAVDRNNATKADIVVRDITIDTVGPRVTNFLFNRPAGEVVTTLQDDRSGLAQQTIIDNAFYSIRKPHTANGTYLFTSLTATPNNGPTAPQTVTGVINNNLKLRGGVYTFTLTSGGVTDVAGNALDGEFYGYIPSGNGQRGGDFVAVIDTVHARILSPKPMNGFGTPNVPPGALLPSYTIRPGRTITPRPPRFHLQGGTGNLPGLPPAQLRLARLQAAQHPRAFAGIFAQRHHKIG